MVCAMITIFRFAEAASVLIYLSSSLVTAGMFLFIHTSHKLTHCGVPSF